MNDNSNVGEYTVTVRNEISVPDDATKASYRPVVALYTFII